MFLTCEIFHTFFLFKKGHGTTCGLGFALKSVGVGAMQVFVQ